MPNNYWSTVRDHTDVGGNNTEPGHSFTCEHPKCDKFWKDIAGARRLADKAELKEHGGTVIKASVLREEIEYECTIFGSLGYGPYWKCGWCGSKLGTKLKEIRLGLKCTCCQSTVSRLFIMVEKRMRIARKSRG